MSRYGTLYAHWPFLEQAPSFGGVPAPPDGAVLGRGAGAQDLRRPQLGAPSAGRSDRDVDGVLSLPHRARDLGTDRRRARGGRVRVPAHHPRLRELLRHGAAGDARLHRRDLGLRALPADGRDLYAAASVAGFAFAALHDWEAFIWGASLLAFVFFRAFVIPPTWLGAIDGRKLGRYWGAMVGAAALTLVVILAMIVHANRIADVFAIYGVRSAGHDLPLAQVLEGRHVRIEMMFTALGIALGKLAAPIMLARFLDPACRARGAAFVCPLHVRRPLRPLQAGRRRPHLLAPPVRALLRPRGGRAGRHRPRRLALVGAADSAAAAAFLLSPLGAAVVGARRRGAAGGAGGARRVFADQAQPRERRAVHGGQPAERDRSVGRAALVPRRRAAAERIAFHGSVRKLWHTAWEIGPRQASWQQPVAAPSPSPVRPRRARRVRGRAARRRPPLSRPRRRLAVGDGSGRARRAAGRLQLRRARSRPVRVVVVRRHRADSARGPGSLGHLGVAHAARPARGRANDGARHARPDSHRAQRRRVEQGRGERRPPSAGAGLAIESARDREVEPRAGAAGRRPPPRGGAQLHAVRARRGRDSSARRSRSRRTSRNDGSCRRCRSTRTTTTSRRCRPSAASCGRRGTSIRRPPSTATAPARNSSTSAGRAPPKGRSPLPLATL